MIGTQASDASIGTSHRAPMSKKQGMWQQAKEITQINWNTLKKQIN